MKTHAEVHEMTEDELWVFAEEYDVELDGLEFTDLEDAAGYVCAKLDIATNGDDEEDEDEDDDEEEEEKKKKEEEDEDDDGAIQRLARQAGAVYIREASGTAGRATASGTRPGGMKKPAESGLEGAG